MLNLTLVREIQPPNSSENIIPTSGYQVYKAHSSNAKQCKETQNRRRLKFRQMLSCCAFNMARSALFGRGFLLGFLGTGVSRLSLFLLFDELEGVEVEFPDAGAESNCFFFLALFLLGLIGGGVGSLAISASGSFSELESEPEESDSTLAGDSSIGSTFCFVFV